MWDIQAHLKTQAVGNCLGNQAKALTVQKHLTTILAPLVRKCPVSHGEIHWFSNTKFNTWNLPQVISSCHPMSPHFSRATQTVKKQIHQDIFLNNRTFSVTPDQICSPLDLCLQTLVQMKNDVDEWSAPGALWCHLEFDWYEFFTVIVSRQ